MKRKKSKKKTVKKTEGWTFWRKNIKESLLGAFNWCKDSISSVLRKTWDMLLDDNYGLAWGGILFGVLTLLNVLNPWDLFAMISIGLGVRHLWTNHHWH